ncbi:hypothetical protein C8R44DRAFT_849444 [Mycena epipterygia]|nr:hypothetical protein C8R44DRAFT_849444 [Mycena epipterygia]
MVLSASAVIFTFVFPTPLPATPSCPTITRGCTITHFRITPEPIGYRVFVSARRVARMSRFSSRLLRPPACSFLGASLGFLALFILVFHSSLVPLTLFYPYITVSGPISTVSDMEIPLVGAMISELYVTSPSLFSGWRIKTLWLAEFCPTLSTPTFSSDTDYSSAKIKFRAPRPVSALCASALWPLTQTSSAISVSSVVQTLLTPLQRVCYLCPRLHDGELRCAPATATEAGLMRTFEGVYFKLLNATLELPKREGDNRERNSCASLDHEIMRLEHVTYAHTGSESEPRLILVQRDRHSIRLFPLPSSTKAVLGSQMDSILAQDLIDRIIGLLHDSDSDLSDDSNFIGFSVLGIFRPG